MERWSSAVGARPANVIKLIFLDRRGRAIICNFH